MPSPPIRSDKYSSYTSTSAIPVETSWLATAIKEEAWIKETQTISQPLMSMPHSQSHRAQPPNWRKAIGNNEDKDQAGTHPQFPGQVIAIDYQGAISYIHLGLWIHQLLHIQVSVQGLPSHHHGGGQNSRDLVSMKLSLT